MPSGAKRRKAAAAKKKKETPSGSGATDSFNGVEDSKGQESYWGEVSSCAAQDLLESGGLAQSFTEEGGDGDSSPVPQIDSGKDIVEEVVAVEAVKGEEDEDRVEIAKELKDDDVPESRDLSVEVVKSAEGSSDGSSSSSSDEETIDIEKIEVVLDPVKLDEVNEVVDNAVDSQVPEFVVEEVVENALDTQTPDFVAEEVVENAVDSQVSKLVAEEVLENAVDSEVPEFVAEEVMENAVDSQMPDFVTEVVVENVAGLSLPDFVAEVVENAVDSPVPECVVDDVVYVSEASPIEEPHEDLNKPVLSEAKYEIKATTDDGLPAHPIPIESHGESAKVVSFDVKETDDKALPPSDSPITVTSNGVGHLKEPEIHDCVVNQTPIAQGPLSVHRTSWAGCCGLFEVFAGSRL